MTPVSKRILWACGLTLVVMVVLMLLPPRWLSDPAVHVRPHHHLLPVTTTSTSTSTSTTILAPVHTHSSPHPTVATASRGAPHVVSGDVWAALAQCESHTQNVADASGHYFGFFQFSLSTWHGIGETGNPMDYSYEVQRAAAQRLVARSGWGQFPVCGRRVA